MKLIKSPILLFTLLGLLNSCTTLKEAGDVMRNEKSASTDQFLIKKKEPLTQPPDFEKIPEPSSIKVKAEQGQSNIEKMLRTNQAETNNNKIKSSSTEQTILKKIQK